MIERNYPLEVVRYGLIARFGRAWEFRGGCGMLRELRCLADRTTLSIGTDRRTLTPWGIDTEHRALGVLIVSSKRPTGRAQLPTKIVAVLQYRDTLLTETPGGGGWGNPLERDREAVADDVAEGLISPDRAAAIYGLRK